MRSWPRALSCENSQAGFAFSINPALSPRNRCCPKVSDIIPVDNGATLGVGRNWYEILRALKEEVSSAKNNVYWYDCTSRGHWWLFARLCPESFRRAFITRRNRKRLEYFDGCADRYSQGSVAAHT